MFIYGGKLMQENYRVDELHKYSENYNSVEYNRIKENSKFSETFKSTEFGDSGESKTFSNNRRKSVEARRSRIINGTLLSAMGTVVGATVITVAIVIAAIIQINILSYFITPTSINVKLKIDNANDTKLTAYLYNDDEYYIQDVSLKDSECNLFFSYLKPNTQYFFEIKDKNSNSYLLKQYTTSSVIELNDIKTDELNAYIKLTLNEWPHEVAVYLIQDGVNVAEPYILEETGVVNLSFGNLAPDTNYLLEIRDNTNVVYYFETITTKQIENPLEYKLNYMMASEISLSFESENLCDYPYNVYLNGELCDNKLDLSMPNLLLSGLSGNTLYNIQIKDSITSKLLMWENFLTPNINVMLDFTELSQDIVNTGYMVDNPQAEEITVNLYLNDYVMNSQTFSESGPFSTVFSGCQSNTEYYIEITDSLGTVLYSHNVKTASYFIFPMTDFQEITENGKDVILMERKSDLSENVLAFEYTIPFDIEGNISIECISSEGYTLPVNFDYAGEPGNYYMCYLYNEFAVSNIYYELRLYKTGDSSSTQIIETRYIKIADEETPFEAPSFDININYNEDTSMFEIDISLLSGTEFIDSSGEMVYELRIIDSNTNELAAFTVTEDFLTTTTQKLFAEGSYGNGKYNLMLIFIPYSEMQSYTIYSCEFNIE